jgi:hypothetical protein
MMKREWKAILGRYGRMVTVCTPGRADENVKVFLHPVLDKDTQIQPSPLGLRREERVLYLGPGEVEQLPHEDVEIISYDGLTLRGGLLTFFVFGDDGWTLEGFYRAFLCSLQISAYLGIANIALAVMERLKK